MSEAEVTKRQRARLARRLLRHRYNGLCPDEVEGWHSRDPQCPGCRALDELLREVVNGA